MVVSFWVVVSSLVLVLPFLGLKQQAQAGNDRQTLCALLGLRWLLQDSGEISSLLLVVSYRCW